MLYLGLWRGGVPNDGELMIVHRIEESRDVGFVIQRAKVDCPILSVRYFTRMDCKAVFQKGGGIIYYPDGRKIPFIERLGVFFVALNILPPKTIPYDVGMLLTTQEQKASLDKLKDIGFPEPDFVRQGHA